MKLKEQAIYEAGPYKGYHGRAEYDGEAELFHGRLAGTRDVITFEGRTVAEVRKAFQESVDDYLAWCAQRGKSPDKPLSGKLLLRMPPTLHKSLESLAQDKGQSLNALLVALAEGATKGATGKSRSKKRQSKR